MHRQDRCLDAFKPTAALPDKTAKGCCATSQRIKDIDSSLIYPSGSLFSTVSTILDLGVILTSDLSMLTYVNQLVNRRFYQLRRAAIIRCQSIPWRPLLIAPYFRDLILFIYLFLQSMLKNQIKSLVTHLWQSETQIKNKKCQRRSGHTAKCNMPSYSQLVLRSRHFVRHLGICNPICVKLYNWRAVSLCTIQCKTRSLYINKWLSYGQL